MDASPYGEGMFDVCAKHQDDELVASETAYQIGVAHGVAQHLGGRIQDGVTSRVAELIVDEFEVVEVDEEQRDRPCRRQLLSASLKELDENAKKDRKTKITALRRAITEAETKRKNLVRNLELTDVDQDFVRDVNERRAELQGEIEGLRAQLTKAEDEVQQASNPGLLDFLPVTPVELTELPDELSRKLFEVLRL